MFCTTIEALQKGLQEANITSEVAPDDEQSSLTQLLVPLGKDEQQRQLTAQVRIIENRAPEGKDSPSQYLSHVLFVFPFAVDQTVQSDMARLTNLMNKTLLIPGLMYSESDNAIAFHHVNAGTQEGVHHQSVEMTLMSVVYVIQMFMPLIEHVAQKQKTFAEVVKEAESMLNASGEENE